MNENKHILIILILFIVPVLFVIRTEENNLKELYACEIECRNSGVISTNAEWSQCVSSCLKGEIYEGATALIVENSIRARLNRPERVEEVPDTIENQIREICVEENFCWTDYLVRLAFLESSLNSKAVGDNGMSRGLFQIHKGYWDVSDECCFDVRCSTLWAIQKINEGKQEIWTMNELAKLN